MRMQPLEPHPIAAASTAVTAFAGRTRRGPLDRPVQVNSAAEFGAIFGGLWDESPLSFAVQHFFENGGHTALVARVAARDATEFTPGSEIGDADLVPAGGRDTRQGIYLLEHKPNFDLLVIPPFSWDRDPAPSTWSAAAAYCRERRAFLLIDPPAGSASGAVDAVGIGLAALLKSLPQSSADAQNAAFFYPRVIVKNPLTETTQPFAPAGAIAGMMGRIDAVSGVWTSPAGNAATIRGAVGLERDLTQAELATLASLGVNSLRTVPPVGVVSWGGRTLQGVDGLSPEWNYVSVTRLELFVEKSIGEGTRWAVFEPNNERLWSRIRSDVGEFLHALFRQGAFQGHTPEDAYFVRCGLDTMTQADIEQGILNIQVGFAPIRPAEFLILPLRHMTDLAP